MKRDKTSGTRYVSALAGLAVLLFLLAVLNLCLGSSAISLLRSESAGEKPPRANWLLGLLGVALLAGAYWLAVTIQDPVTAMVWFFVAVIMVILATYLLMISGSVVLCRLLQKNKNYYYQKQHFVSVSSMAYRMKRNGAGLASICVLSTMVLVMISSTSSLYIGMEDSIKARYPHDSGFAMNVERLEDLGDEDIAQVQQALQKVYRDSGVEPKRETGYRYAVITGLAEKNGMNPEASETVMDTINYNNLREAVFIPVADYNAVNGTDLALEPGQAMIDCLRCTYDAPDFQIGEMKLEILGKLPRRMDIGESVVSVVPSITMVVSSMEQIRPLEDLLDYKNRPMLTTRYYYGCDLDLPEEEIIRLHNRQKQAIIQTGIMGENIYKGYEECPARERADFYITFGGLFFIGIVLSVVFIAAAALIVYYKQVSDGYEDQSRFAIMRKVGMTRVDIKKSINSQILTVFFAPLLMAGMHLIFAFPMVWQLLQMFNLRNLKLVIMTNIASFLVFCLFYVVIYKFTARAYYGIVSNDERK